MANDIGFDSMKAIPNKFLNPDGSYSTLTEILAGALDTDLFIVVDELPEIGEANKIYIVEQDGKLIEYIWLDDQWDPIGMIEFDIDNYYTKTQTDSNFLKKTNTTAYTPTGDYNPATKQYVDTNAVSFKPFPNTFVTNSTTQAFLNSIRALNLPVGMVYLGQVSLSDMPDGVTVQAEVEVYVYPQNVIYCVMRSAEVDPYLWECNSYEYRGWESIDDTIARKNLVNTTDYATAIKGGVIKLGYGLNVDGAGTLYSTVYTYAQYVERNNPTFISKGTLENVITGKQLLNATDAASDYLKKDNATAYTPTGNYNPATKKYVDDAISSAINVALGGDY